MSSWLVCELTGNRETSNRGIIMQGKYLSKTDFDLFIENEAKPLLKYLKLEPKKKNLLNQFAARMLKFSSYEAIQPFHQKEKILSESLVVENCPVQGGRLTIKSTGVVVVVDTEKRLVMLRYLKSGEEGLYISPSSDTQCINYSPENSNDFERVELNPSHVNVEESDSGAIIATLSFVQKDSQKNDEFCALSVTKTYEGIICDMAYSSNAGGDAEFIDTMAVCYSDYDEDEHNTNLAAPLNSLLLPKSDGDYYQWLKPVFIDGELRYIKVDSEKVNEIDLSDILFDSQSAAIEAVRNNTFGYTEECVSGFAIVKVTKTIDKLFFA